MGPTDRTDFTITITIARGNRSMVRPTRLRDVLAAGSVLLTGKGLMNPQPIAHLLAGDATPADKQLLSIWVGDGSSTARGPSFSVEEDLGDFDLANRVRCQSYRGIDSDYTQILESLDQDERFGAVIIDLSDSDPFGMAEVPSWFDPRPLIEKAKQRDAKLILTIETPDEVTAAWRNRVHDTVEWSIEARSAFGMVALSILKGPAVQRPHGPILLDGSLEGPPIELLREDTAGSFAYGYREGAPGFWRIQAGMEIWPGPEEPSINGAPKPDSSIARLIAAMSDPLVLDLSGFTYYFCFGDPELDYREELDLAVAAGLLSGYLGRRVPEGSVFVGELDRGGKLVAPGPGYLRSLAKAIASRRDQVSSVYTSPSAAKKLEKTLAGAPTEGLKLDVHGVPDLTTLVHELWLKDSL